jgi:hypothetical protein
MRRRPFAYADVYRHPDAPPGAFDHRGREGEAMPFELACRLKNESNCTVFLSDGTWFTTWSQGICEGHPVQRIVFATSRDLGRTWTEPAIAADSCPEREEGVAYGAPFVVPETDRIYVFYFMTAQTEGPQWAAEGRRDSSKRRVPLHGSGVLCFVYSDDAGATWSDRRVIDLPNRDWNAIPGRFFGWVNHPAQQMPDGTVMLPISWSRRHARHWQIGAGEVGLVRCDNILTESDPDKLAFTLLPEGPRGIRVPVREHWDNPAVNRLVAYYDGVVEETVPSFEELTIVPLSDGRWLGVGRTSIGSPGYTISADAGETWTPVETLRTAPGGETIDHPHTMCPIAKTDDGRYVLLFTNNDGTKRGAEHVWHGNGRTRNPQWITVGREVPGEHRNAGLVFGEPMVLAEVDDSGETNLKTGISMPQFFEVDGRRFVCYNINKQHILLDEIPGDVFERLTP